MTTKEKKEYGIFAVLVVITLGVIYFNFLKPEPTTSGPIAAYPSGTTTIPGTGAGAGTSPTTGAPSAGTTTPAGAGATATPSTGSALLPNGSSLQVDILRKKPFSDFTPPIYPTVTKSEVGSDNVFGK